MQVCHGKAGSLRRIKPGDGIAYYSPSEVFGGGTDRLQAFTAIGRVREGEPSTPTWAAASARSDAMSPGAAPRRRRSSRWSAGSSSRRRRPNWGFQLRFGLFEISGA